MSVCTKKCGFCGNMESDVDKELLTCPLAEWVRRKGLCKLWMSISIHVEMAGGIEKQDVSGTVRNIFISLRQHMNELGEMK